MEVDLTIPCDATGETRLRAAAAAAPAATAAASGAAGVPDDAQQPTAAQAGFSHAMRNLAAVCLAKYGCCALLSPTPRPHVTPLPALLLLPLQAMSP